ncbi:tRNA (adenosine(37)-N6)-dimethylallyltransferase MiaA [Paenibacillus sp. P25]|nr:tRNA (adenosine(37)-N6)-dimethylallyltransferase MiaA [Paenibacillus sp. P25]
MLVGPTAVGKTKLSLALAEESRAEIISGDSMQVYRGMDIGTAKATPEERALVPHHMIDIHDPDYPFSVAEFQERCVSLIKEIDGRGRLPFIVGGTGLYIESVCYDFQFGEGGADDHYREELRQFAEAYGPEALHERLREVDPETAERLHPNDQRRIIRALEIFHVTGERLSDRLKVQKRLTPYELCIVGLTMDRGLLYKRIEDRIDQMIGQGLVEEVQGLLEKGYTTDLISMQGLGYKEIAAYLLGQGTLEEAVELLKKNTRHFAKRQLSWFRRMKDIEWVDMSDLTDFSTHYRKVRAIISGKLLPDR